jgi:hypothetical protein
MTAKKRKPRKRSRTVEPAHVVEFTLVEVPDQFFYARFKNRTAALQFVNFDDKHDVIESAALL